MAARLFLAILFIACFCSVTLAQVPIDCCLTVAEKPIHKSAVANYYHQQGGEGCHIHAIVFVSRNGRTMCAPTNELWVHNLIRHVDNLKKICQLAVNSKSKRCIGVKAK